MSIIGKIATTLFATAIVAGAAYGGRYLYNTRLNKPTQIPKNNLNFEIKSESEYKENDVFPNIYANDFYDTIKVKNGEVIIDELLVEAIIKEIIAKFRVAFGSLSFRYSIDKAKKTIFIEFLWKYKKNKINRNYKIILYKDS
ncbi:MHO_1590 family protein [Mycoplasma sp. 'Moose RK']|uniref:MHO_1590 family protein n=1 Tax=Mycoplasma sp. 'Moose RK' TaxID=2780095 RepID=UPI0018C31E5A|nr:hypothetical protein [Mycoplasma sp. 'Moose RK']MBG0730493.1 hypothetical protein [Mycoplasma sp. 'Moose RK']